MADKYVLDTHTLIWFIEGNKRLSAKAKAVIEDQSNDLILPVIALAEAMFIVERGKTTIPDVQTLLDRIDGDHRITIFTLDRTVMDKTLELQSIPEMHDRQIAATALVLSDLGHTSFLLTKDDILVASDSVSTIW